MIALTLSFILASPVLFIILVLFGAPLTTHFPHTFLLATHIALIAVLPLFYVHGVNGQKWRAVGGMALPMDEVFGGTFGALMGAWLGAVPIPLDW
jgi:phosphatidylinositol glycan class F